MSTIQFDEIDYSDYEKKLKMISSVKLQNITTLTNDKTNIDNETLLQHYLAQIRGIIDNFSEEI